MNMMKYQSNIKEILMKNKKNFLIVVLVVFLFSACTNFKDEYKPLYQAKPEIDSVKKN
jgi:capsular polysaccharide biosynthesis protein